MAERRQIVQGPDGRALVVREDGDPDGFPVLVHHGTPGSGRLYAPWAQDAARRGIRLVGYDRPGYGESTRHAGRSIADAAADVAAIADALGFERFATWGASGGGPHALATAALLGGRVVAAATIASVAPCGAPGLEFMTGMGEDNVVEFEAALAGEATLREALDAMREAILGGGQVEAAAEMETLLSAGDAELMGGPLGAYVLDSIRLGLEHGVDGWLDDDLAFVRTWGFDPATIAVPVQLRQGAQDRMVPFAHGEWLAARIPGVDAQLTAGDGHLTLLERVGEVHAWLATTRPEGSRR